MVSQPTVKYILSNQNIMQRHFLWPYAKFCKAPCDLVIAYYIGSLQNQGFMQASSSRKYHLTIVN